jgi:hypothetical protein
MKSRIVTYVFITLALFCSMNSIYSSEMDLFSIEEKSRLLDGEIITRMYLKYNAKGENTHLEMDLPNSTAIPEEMKGYEMLTDEKAFIPYETGSDGLLPVINSMVSFSRLKGTRYWSRRAGAVETLIVDSYAIDSPDDKQMIPDPVLVSIPGSVEYYFVQKDNKFGKTGYRYTISTDDDTILVKASCFHPVVFKKLIPVNGRDEMKVITILEYDSSRKGFYYYALYGMRINLDLFLRNGALRPTSFANRLRAATVHLAVSLGNDWTGKLNPWDEETLISGGYRMYIVK